MNRHNIGALAVLAVLLQACSSTPKTPAIAEPTAPVLRQADKAYRVEAGDSLSAIARKTTGDGDNWKAIAQYNDIRNPNHLRVGDPLMIPGELLPPDEEPVVQVHPLDPPAIDEPEKAESQGAAPQTDQREMTQSDSRWVVVEGSYYPKAIYERPAYTGALITRVLPGTTLKFLGQNKNWLHVETDKGPGYLHESDARLLAPDAQQSSLSTHF